MRMPLPKNESRWSQKPEERTCLEARNEKRAGIVQLPEGNFATSSCLCRHDYRDSPSIRRNCRWARPIMVFVRAGDFSQFFPGCPTSRCFPSASVASRAEDPGPDWPAIAVSQADRQYRHLGNRSVKNPVDLFSGCATVFEGQPGQLVTFGDP